MSEEEIINNIRASITYNENIYLLCDSLEDIIKNNNKQYDIQLIVTGLLDLYNKEKEKNKELQIKLMEQDLFIDGLKEDRRIAVEEIQEQFFVSKDKLKKVADDYESKGYIEIAGAIQELLEEDIKK